MNDSDLDSKLRSAPVPSRGDDYWDDFPQRVRAQLRRPVPVERTTPGAWWPRLAWGGGIAFACLVASLLLWCGPGQLRHEVSIAMFQNEKSFREFAQISNHLRVLLQDQHGLHNLVADQE